MTEYSRYIIGIDLGTTNSAACYIDTEARKLPHQQIHTFRIPQLTAPGIVETKEVLPSFYYISSDHELPRGTLNLPWSPASPDRESTILKHAVGTFAKEHGARVPTNLVRSAKSWLCNSTANRKEKILPTECADPSRRISPVEAASAYLNHIKNAWNAVIAKHNPAKEFEQQHIVLTVPASFDEFARALTVEAAKAAGFVQMTLLEEPQAAFYSWIFDSEASDYTELKSGERVLVCDVGGGTTDFSLIDVTSVDGKLSFQRMAVGSHLLLGGDNMDNALCHHLEAKLRQGGSPELTTQQWLQLLHKARAAKESLFSKEASSSETLSIVLEGTGSLVIEGSLSVEVSKQELIDILMNGFFGLYPLSEAVKIRHQGGIRTMGLPYESEPSITKHLAHFLQNAEGDKQPRRPDHILFNGGSLKPSLFQEAILRSMKEWFSGEPPTVLHSKSLDLAVARGATYFGLVCRGTGTRISGGAARNYYLGIEVKRAEGSMEPKALTLLPRGSEEGARYTSDKTFQLIPNTPVSFTLFTSNTRLHDKIGDLISINEEEMHPLPPLTTILKFGKKQPDPKNVSTIPVKLTIHLTEIGTLELWVESQTTEHKWALEFQVRASQGSSSSGQDYSLSKGAASRIDETFDSAYLEKAKETITFAFSKNGTLSPAKIITELERLLEKPRQEWPPSTLRGLWSALIESAPHRTISADHEARWWNLAGFFLRPGFGHPLDDFRVKELWRLILSESKQTKNSEKNIQTQIQRWICYRRIAAGLNKGQQVQLSSELLPFILSKQVLSLDTKQRTNAHEYAEKIRALAAMEWLDISVKTNLGAISLEKILSGNGEECDYWALGRLGARHLLHGGVTAAIPAKTCELWAEKLLSPKLDKGKTAFVIGQLARKTDQRELNLTEVTIDKILKHFEGSNQRLRLKELLTQVAHLSGEEQAQVFGESLPSGLILEE